jgi:hypothetical protein
MRRIRPLQHRRRAGRRNALHQTAKKPMLPQSKDELDDALGDLNRSTNRLRRKFDPTDKWTETKPRLENMLDDGRRINQAVTRGNHGSEVARLWATLRTAMNELACAYGCATLGV